jgi:hypothetical protein
VYGVMSTDSEVSSPPRQPARVAVNIKKARNRGVLLRMAKLIVLNISSLLDSCTSKPMSSGRILE